jgi:hypothetical protein
MNLQEQISRMKSIMGLITESDEDRKKNIMFKFWDKVGFENAPLISDFDIDESMFNSYVKEYLGDDYQNYVIKEVDSIVNNITECDGDEFSVRVNYINFNETDNTFGVSLGINFNSPIFQTIDLNDSDDVLTAFGQIERCVEDIINDIIYDKYGTYTTSVFIDV